MSVVSSKTRTKNKL